MVLTGTAGTKKASRVVCSGLADLDIALVIQVNLPCHYATVWLMPYAIEEPPHWQLGPFSCKTSLFEIPVHKSRLSNKVVKPWR